MPVERISRYAGCAFSVFRFNCIAISKSATTSINSTDKRKIQFYIMSAFRQGEKERERERGRGAESGSCGLYIDRKLFSRNSTIPAAPARGLPLLQRLIFRRSITVKQIHRQRRAASWPLTTAQVSQLSLPGRRRSRTHQCATLPSLSLPHCGCTPLTTAERERERENCLAIFRSLARSRKEKRERKITLHAWLPG